MDGGVGNTLPLFFLFFSSNCIYFTSFVVSLFYFLPSQILTSTPCVSCKVDTESFWLSGSIFSAYCLTTIHGYTIPCLNRAPSNRPISRTLPRLGSTSTKQGCRTPHALVSNPVMDSSSVRGTRHRHISNFLLGKSMAPHANHEGTALFIIHFVVLSITLIMAFCSDHSAVCAIAPFIHPSKHQSPQMQTLSTPKQEVSRAGVSERMYPYNVLCYFLQKRPT